MTGKVEQRLAELGIVLPAPAKPAANYVPFTCAGTLVFVSGQLPMDAGRLIYIGKLGRDFDIDEGQEAARLCALNVLAQVKAAVGDLDRVKTCIRLGGFVNAVPEFTDHPAVINGASDLIAQVLGDAGRHARAAVGAASLPLGAAVEIDAIFEIA